MQWVPATTDESLVVHKEKPQGIYYKCQFCKGWIEGRPRRYQEDTLAPLSGRRGTAEHCLRCGREISFFGVMS